MFQTFLLLFIFPRLNNKSLSFFHYFNVIDENSDYSSTTTVNNDNNNNNNNNNNNTTEIGAKADKGILRIKEGR